MHHAIHEIPGQYQGRAERGWEGSPHWHAVARFVPHPAAGQPEEIAFARRCRDQGHAAQVAGELAERLEDHRARTGLRWEVVRDRMDMATDEPERAAA